MDELKQMDIDQLNPKEKLKIMKERKHQEIFEKMKVAASQSHFAISNSK